MFTEKQFFVSNFDIDNLFLLLCIYFVYLDGLVHKYSVLCQVTIRRIFRQAVKVDLILVACIPKYVIENVNTVLCSAPQTPGFMAA